MVVLCIILPAASMGQVGSLVKNKLNRVVGAGAKTLNKEINKEIDTAVEKGVTDAREKTDEKIETNRQSNADQSDNNEGSQSSGQGSEGLNFGRFLGNKVDLPHKEDYDFSSRMYMVTESYDNDEVLKIDLFMFYSAASPNVGIETKSLAGTEGDAAPIPTSMILDGENKCFMVLTDVNGMKMGIISPVVEENTSTADDKSKKKNTPPTFTKTGNTRVVAGYKCDEYSFVDPDDESTGKVWFTKDAALKIDKRGWQNTGMSEYYGTLTFDEGLILATEVYDKKGKLTSKTETKEINATFPHSISIKGYTLRQMNLAQGDKK